MGGLMEGKEIDDGDGGAVVGRTKHLFNIVNDEGYVPMVWKAGDSVLLENGGDRKNPKNL